MDAEPVTIPAGLPAARAYEDFFLRYQGWDWFAVVDDDGRYIGLAHRRAVEHAALEEGGAMAVRDVAAPSAAEAQVPRRRAAGGAALVRAAAPARRADGGRRRGAAARRRHVRAGHAGAAGAVGGPARPRVVERRPENRGHRRARPARPRVVERRAGNGGPSGGGARPAPVNGGHRGGGSGGRKTSILGALVTAARRSSPPRRTTSSAAAGTAPARRSADNVTIVRLDPRYPPDAGERRSAAGEAGACDVLRPPVDPLEAAVDLDARAAAAPGRATGARCERRPTGVGVSHTPSATLRCPPLT